jgi:predicted  nucleic acid-binding Zn-ribbon protein
VPHSASSGVIQVVALAKRRCQACHVSLSIA